MIYVNNQIIDLQFSSCSNLKYVAYASIKHEEEHVLLVQAELHGSQLVPDRVIDEVLGRDVKVDVLGTARVIRPGAAKRRIKVLGRVEIQTERRQILAEGERHQIRIGLGRPDEREQTNHPELVGHHVCGNVTHSSIWGRSNTAYDKNPPQQIVIILTHVKRIR